MPFDPAPQPTADTPEESVAPTVAIAVRPVPTQERKLEHMPRWNVVLIDSDEHSYEYVVRMMQQLFARPVTAAYEIAVKVDSQGRAICLTTHKEHAELKRDQIHAFGRDPLMATCVGSMTAVIEPAEFDADDSIDSRD